MMRKIFYTKNVASFHVWTSWFDQVVCDVMEWNWTPEQISRPSGVLVRNDFWGKLGKLDMLPVLVLHSFSLMPTP